MCAETNIKPPTEANYPSINCNTVNYEMITRAPIESAPGVFCDSFKIDSKSVWYHLADLLRDTKECIYLIEGFLSWPQHGK